MVYRSLRDAALDRCTTMVNPALELSARTRAALPALWRRLLSAGQLYGGIVVDEDREGDAALLACGMTVFVNERFVDDYLRAPSPYPAAIVYERLLENRSPVLDVRQVAVANAAAELNLLILHFGARQPAPHDDRGRATVATAQEGFRRTHIGYRLKRVLAEAYGPEVPFYRAGGFLVKDDYTRFYATAPVPAPERRPYLVGMFADDPESRITGSTLSYLFQRNEPRFHFSPAEQRVLSRAVMDDSDTEIAAALDVSNDTVKKTWLRVHQRVAAVAPELARDAPDALTRGKERRRRLIHYLRYHPEELRPFARRVPD
jgi:hypothetical protein